MTEFEKLYDDEFFIIDSDNLKSVTSKMYGFTIIDTNIHFNPTYINEEKLDGTGTYVYISEKNNEITIFQDFSGSYGLYYYFNKKEEYFALSNSFLKLVEYLKEKFILTFNHDYAKSFLSSDFCSIVYKQTLINEIELIPENYIIHINKKNKKITFSKINYEENSILIDSKKGLEILDKWFLKWVKILNNLYYNTENIKIDLSGGFDSRLVLSLILSSNINLKKIQILSNKSNNPVFKEDYEIASQISKDFGFELNKNQANISKYYFQDLETSLNLSFYSKLGFSKQLYWKNFIYDSKVFHITGYGGELIRAFYKSPSIEKYIEYSENLASAYSSDFKKSVRKLINYTFNQYTKEFGNLSTSELFFKHYKCTRNRYHLVKHQLNLY